MASSLHNRASPCVCGWHSELSSQHRLHRAYTVISITESRLFLMQCHLKAHGSRVPLFIYLLISILCPWHTEISPHYMNPLIISCTIDEVLTILWWGALFQKCSTICRRESQRFTLSKELFLYSCHRHIANLPKTNQFITFKATHKTGNRHLSLFLFRFQCFMENIPPLKSFSLSETSTFNVFRPIYIWMSKVLSPLPINYNVPSPEKDEAFSHFLTATKKGFQKFNICGLIK